MSDSVQPHRRKPTRLPHPWDSPGKNTGVSCHFLLQCMKVKSESEVAQLCPTLSDPKDCSLPGSSAHGIFQARVLEWVAIAFSGNTWGDLKFKHQVSPWRTVSQQVLKNNNKQKQRTLGKRENQISRVATLLLACDSVQFSHSVTLWPHGLQHTRPPCPSPTPGAYSNSCPLSRWCHPTISSSIVPFSSCLQSFPASGSFQMSQFFTSGGQSTGVSASASVLPMNIQDWLPLGYYF